MLSKKTVWRNGRVFQSSVYRENNQLSKITGGSERKPAEKDVKTGGKKDEKINKTEYQKAEIINYLLEFGEIDNNKVQLLIKVKKSRAREILNIMVQNKQLKKCSFGKNTFYILERT